MTTSELQFRNFGRVINTIITSLRKLYDSPKIAIPSIPAYP